MVSSAQLKNFTEIKTSNLHEITHNKLKENNKNIRPIFVLNRQGKQKGNAKYSIIKMHLYDFWEKCHLNFVASNPYNYLSQNRSRLAILSRY